LIRMTILNQPDKCGQGGRIDVAGIDRQRVDVASGNHGRAQKNYGTDEKERVNGFERHLSFSGHPTFRFAK